MSKVTLAILFAMIILIIIATYYDVAYLGGGPGVLLIAALSYAYVVARRQAALMTYVLSENQIISEDEGSNRAPVPTGVSNPPKSRPI